MEFGVLQKTANGWQSIAVSGEAGSKLTDECPSTNPIAANVCSEFQTCLGVCSKKPSSKSLPRRILCCYWKQWRHTRARRRELTALGVRPRQAACHARSRKGPWHMAKTIASGVGKDERLVANKRGLEPKDTLGRACSTSLNRRMRTRMHGGVGRVPGNGRENCMACDCYPWSSRSFVVSVRAP